MSVIQLNTGPTLAESIEAAIETVVRLIEAGHSIAMTLSSGKDSTTTTLLCGEAIRRVALSGRPQANHYVSSSSTAVENPEIEDNLLTMHEDIRRWAASAGLPIEVHMVHPAPAAKFVVATIGRGTLPRFVENGSSNRACSIDWKRQPQQRLAKRLGEIAQAEGFKETITVLGTRIDESAARGSAMRRRGETAQSPVRSEEGFLTLSLIADWSEGMVWEFLAQFLTPETTPFPAFVDEIAVRRMLDLYRDANSGVCGMFIGDGQRAPCGSRFGCVICTISGQRDKSMESLLESGPQYDYLRGLNEFRNFLVKTQWDMSRRELIGRTLSPVGYLPVRPDVYNLPMRQAMLRYLLTLDELERERAEALDAAIARGDVESTPYNERMRYPQFEMVTVPDIVLIDFYWSMHPYASSAFPALAIWFDVKTLGRRNRIPKLDAVSPIPIPAKRWFKVGAFDADAPTDGLRDYGAEMWNRYLHPERPLVNRMAGSERTVWFEEADQLEVDAGLASEFVETYCGTAMAIESGFHCALESARFWLNHEVIKLPAGMAGRYQTMAKRGQYFAHLAERLQLTPAEMDQHLLESSIDDSAHEELLAMASGKAVKQLDLFAA